MLRLGPGLPARINPLTAGTDEPGGQAAGGGVLTAVTEALLGRGLHPGERSALDASTCSHLTRERVVGDVIDALLDPDPAQARLDGVPLADRAADGQEPAHALRRLTRGELAGMFDAPSTVTLDQNSPMVVIDLSALGADDTATAVAMTCASAWLDSALRTPNGDASVGRWIVYDEAWRLLRVPALLARMQAQWKLARAHGIANLLVLHRLSDLAAVGGAGCEARALAAGLLADCSTRVIYRQETDQLGGTELALGLSDTERVLLPQLPRGCGLWKLPRSAHVVTHHLHTDERNLYDTDAAMRAGNPSAKAGERG